MKINEALKEKNNLVKKLLELQNRITTYNCVIEGNPRAYDPKEVMEELKSTIEKLVNLKTSITRANQSVQDKIYRLSELKSQIRFLKNIPVTEGKAQSGKSYYSQPETYVWESAIKAKERDQHILELEEKIEILQKELDAHNYNTSIQ
ncbi:MULTISPECIES: hypothetical protein [Flavobacteriaceae]|uniref:DIP1984 family protein n=1 Tax=Flavobacteriaceae TaxID=49546 RepID=UPI002349157D|nr:hypothetical protein [Muricauda sp. SP22]MDC6362139.1 hypothetical protein [Muricauda sp. SP22]